MPRYITTIKKLSGSEYITIPKLLSRTHQMQIGDTLLLEPQANGTIIIYPDPMVMEALRNARTQAEAIGGDNE